MFCWSVGLDPRLKAGMQLVNEVVIFVVCCECSFFRIKDCLWVKACMYANKHTQSILSVSVHHLVLIKNWQLTFNYAFGVYGRDFCCRVRMRILGYFSGIRIFLAYIHAPSYIHKHTRAYTWPSAVVKVHLEAKVHAQRSKPRSVGRHCLHGRRCPHCPQ